MSTYARKPTQYRGKHNAKHIKRRIRPEDYRNGPVTVTTPTARALLALIAD